MFYNKLKMDSLAEAAKKVMGEDDLDETGLRKAAYAAHKSGQTMFKFKGKTYPVKVRGEEVEAGEEILDEASEKVPTPTGMKVYGSRYGDSKKARADQLKRPVDDAKGPKEKDLKEDGDCVTKPEAKDIAKKEVHHHNKTMHKGQKDTTKNEETEVKSFKDRLLEREMTSAETKKKEKIVMSMKDKQDYFKKKYGKRWKDVMYATATKQAMKEETEEAEEIEEIQQEAVKKSDVPAFLRKLRGDKPLTVKDVKGAPKDSISHPDNLAKARNEEVEELDEGKHMHTHTVHFACPETGEWKGKMIYNADHDNDAVEMAHDMAKKQGLKVMKVSKNHIVMSDHTMGEEIVYESETSTDMLSGREHGFSQHNDHKAFKSKLPGDELPKVNKVSTGTSTRARDSIKASGGGINPVSQDNLDPKYGKPNSFNVHTEGKDPHMDAGVGAQPDFATEKVIAGTPGWKKMKGDQKGNVTDKSGAVHTPMSRARDLARQSFKKLKSEMLGKAPGNN